jgi:hypothetical protein
MTAPLSVRPAQLIPLRKTTAIIGLQVLQSPPRGADGKFYRLRKTLKRLGPAPDGRTRNGITLSDFYVGQKGSIRPGSDRCRLGSVVRRIILANGRWGNCPSISFLRDYVGRSNTIRPDGLSPRKEIKLEFRPRNGHAPTLFLGWLGTSYASAY